MAKQTWECGSCGVQVLTMVSATEVDAPHKPKDPKKKCRGKFKVVKEE